MQYKLTIITDRDRGSDGKLTKTKIEANNDVEAFVKVFEQFDIQNNYFITEEFLEDDKLERRKIVLHAMESGKNTEEAIEILKEAYFDNLDISDYYDNIVKLECNGRIIFQDEDIDIEEWFGE